MSIFIKAGLWVEKQLGYKGELNLTQFVEALIPTPPDPLPYKSYVAIITQSGTSAPTVNTLLENTLGATVTFGYTNVGEYTINITGNKFTTNKTVIIVGPGRKTTANTFLGTTIASDQLIVLYSQNPSGTPTNGLISQVTVEIRVYN
jgi:hypothetical protein